MPTFHPAYLLRSPGEKRTGLGGYPGSDEGARASDPQARRTPVTSTSGRMARMALAIACAIALSGLLCAAAASADDSWVELIGIDGPINPATADFIEDSLHDAATGGASALVIELDTPGGLLTSTQRIVKDLLGAPIPVIVYVAPSGAGAASAGNVYHGGRQYRRDGARNDDRRGPSGGSGRRGRKRRARREDRELHRLVRASRSPISADATRIGL